MQVGDRTSRRPVEGRANVPDVMLSRRLRPCLRVAILALLALLLGGCRLSIGLDLVVGPGGAGSLTTTFETDQDLASRLLDGGLDPARDVVAVVEEAGWRVVSVADGRDGGPIAVQLEADFRDPAGLDQAVEVLRQAFPVTPDGAPNGALLDTLTVEVEGGGADVTGVVGLRLPTAVGASGDTIDLDTDALRERLAAAPEALLVEVGVTFVDRDGSAVRPTSHDADRVDGGRLVWDVPVSDRRDVNATAQIDAALVRPEWLIAAGLALAAAGLVVTVRRRRRR